MKTLKAITLSAVLVAGAIAGVGCSSAQKGAAGAGLAGGIAGAVVGNNWVPIGPTTGAVVGGSSGAAIGGLVGDAYDQITEEDLERELTNLRAELASREAELAALRNTSPSTPDTAEMQALRDSIAQLEKDLAAAREDARLRAVDAGDADRLRQSLSEAEAQRDALRKDIEKLNEQKGILEQDSKKLGDELQRLKDMLENKEDILSKLNDAASGKDKSIAALEADLNKKAADLAAREQELALKERNLAELDGKYKVLQTSLDGKEAALGSLRGELDKLNVQLEDTSRGLTLTIVNSLLFKSGSSDLSDSGRVLLGDVSRIIQDKFPGRELLIEGHTDNQPIKHSGWRSNWELGAARALNILHELVENHGVSPDKVSATSFGEFRPKAGNSTPETMGTNRRAVIVIIPEKVAIQREALASVN